VFDRVIDSDFKKVRAAVSDVVSYLRAHLGEIEECSLYEIRVILNELILNGIKHGNKEDSNKRVRISVYIDDESFANFTVEDEGEGYNYRYLLCRHCHPSGDAEAYDIKETGRGMLLVKNLCDRIEFNREGNRVKVCKKLHQDLQKLKRSN